MRGVTVAGRRTASARRSRRGSSSPPTGATRAPPQLARVPARRRPHERFGYFAYFKGFELRARRPRADVAARPRRRLRVPRRGRHRLHRRVLRRQGAAGRGPPGPRRGDARALRAAARRARPVVGQAAVSKWLGKVELENQRRPAAARGMAFVGDAAQASDPVWGVGCGFAFQSADWLAEEVSGRAARLGRGPRPRARALRAPAPPRARRPPLGDERLRDRAADDAGREAPVLGRRASTTTSPRGSSASARATCAPSGSSRGAVVRAPRRSGPAAAGARHEDRRGRASTGVRSPTIEAGPQDATEAAVFVHGNPGLDRRLGRAGRARPASTAARSRSTCPASARPTSPRASTTRSQGYARHLAGALGQLGVERAHLVLHDFGGPVGPAVGGRPPRRVRARRRSSTPACCSTTSWHVLARVWRTPRLGELFMRATTRGGLALALRRGQPRRCRASASTRCTRRSKDPGTQRAVLRPLPRDAAPTPLASAARAAARARPAVRSSSGASPTRTSTVEQA